MKRLALVGALVGGCATPQAARVVRLEAEVGASQSAAFSVVHKVTAREGRPALRVRLTFPLSVLAVAAPAGIRFKVGGLELALIPDEPGSLPPEVVEKLAAHMGWADEVAGTGTVSARGSIALELQVPAADGDSTAAALKDAASRALAVVSAALRLVGIPLPDGAVAPGDSWSGQGAVTPPEEQAPATVERRYELVSDDGKVAVVRVHATVRGDGVIGQLDGELQYDRARPLPIGGALRYQAERKGGEPYSKVETDLQIGGP